MIIWFCRFDNIQDFDGAYLSKLDSFDPEEAVICGREEITHFMALQNKAISYHNTTWIEITTTPIGSVHLKKTHF